jgi:hypothetical protein
MSVLSVLGPEASILANQFNDFSASQGSNVAQDLQLGYSFVVQNMYYAASFAGALPTSLPSCYQSSIAAKIDSVIPSITDWLDAMYNRATVLSAVGAESVVTTSLTYLVPFYNSFESAAFDKLGCSAITTIGSGIQAVNSALFSVCSVYSVSYAQPPPTPASCSGKSHFGI